MDVYRPRRNRKSATIRAMVQEVRISPSNLIYPLFLCDGRQKKEEIPSMPGIYRRSLEGILEEIESGLKKGISAIALFPVIDKEQKTPQAQEALNPDGILLRGVSLIKNRFPEVCVITDVALDPYTSHGHDGLVDGKGKILNDEAIVLLAEMAQLHAQAGADMVAPSDMMDGRVGAIRKKLDEKGFQEVSIHAYTAKYASAFYAPFREALASQLAFGDKRTYQMNPANRREALLEAVLDELEGADILMIKPALPYLDIIREMREQSSLPLSAFQVSGEYAMIKAAGAKGWLDEKMAFLETLLCIKRAGADMIFTYAALEIAEFLNQF